MRERCIALHCTALPASNSSDAYVTMVYVSFFFLLRARAQDIQYTPRALSRLLLLACSRSSTGHHDDSNNAALKSYVLLELRARAWRFGSAYPRRLVVLVVLERRRRR